MALFFLPQITACVLFVAVWLGSPADKRLLEHFLCQFSVNSLTPALQGAQGSLSACQRLRCESWGVHDVLTLVGHPDLLLLFSVNYEQLTSGKAAVGEQACYVTALTLFHSPPYETTMDIITAAVTICNAAHLGAVIVHNIHSIFVNNLYFLLVPL